MSDELLHLCGWGTRSRGEREGVAQIKLNDIHYLERLLKVFFCLAGKADDDVSGDRHIRHSSFKILYDLEIFGASVVAIHQL